VVQLLVGIIATAGVIVGALVAAISASTIEKRKSRTQPTREQVRIDTLTQQVISLLDALAECERECVEARQEVGRAIQRANDMISQRSRNERQLQYLNEQVERLKVVIKGLGGQSD
jgi:chromosome segregation ATPase